MTGQPVALVDGDLRRLVVAASFGLVEGLGLTDLVIGRAKIDDAFRSIASLPNLWIIAAAGSRRTQ